MPRLDTGVQPKSYLRDCGSLLAWNSEHSGRRGELFKSILLRSVRIKITKDEAPQLPLRIRPTFILLNAIDLTVLGFLGFHPRSSEWVALNDKVLHFICFFIATALFYFIFDVEQAARRSWFWRNIALILSFVTCFAFGAVGSEVVQSLLPYKTFQWGDVLANLLGSALGLVVSYHLEARYRIRREIERLYQPLDADEYDDASDDEQQRRGTADLEAGQGANKGVRFGEIWSADDDDIWGDGGGRAAPSGPAKGSRSTVFAIAEDAEDDEGGNAWATDAADGKPP